MIKYIVTFLLFVTSCHASENEPIEFIESYLKDFSLQSELTPYFAEKPTFIFGPHTHVPETAKEASDFILGIRAELKESGYASSRIEDAQIRAEIDNYHLVTFTLTRLKESGHVLDVVCSTYGVLDTEEGLKIVSWQPSKMKEKGKC